MKSDMKAWGTALSLNKCLNREVEKFFLNHEYRNRIIWIANSEDEKYREISKKIALVEELISSIKRNIAKGNYKHSMFLQIWLREYLKKLKLDIKFGENKIINEIGISEEYITQPILEVEEAPLEDNYNDSSYEDKSFDSIKSLANSGDIEAQYELACMYYCGEDIEKDYIKATSWYTKAAEQGHREAQYTLGSIYYNLKKNYAMALKWYTKAAEQGHESAQYELGNMYCNGKGVKKDYTKAFKYCTKAAEKGDPDSQFQLATMYFNGNGTRRNYKEAAKWCEEAANQGHMEAQYELGNMYYRGEGVERNNSIAEKWFKEYTNQGGGKSNYSSASKRGKLYS